MMKFQVTTNHLSLPCRVYVHIYDTVEEMRAACLRYNDEFQDLSDTYGVCHRRTVVDSKTHEDVRHEAIVRLAAPNTPTGIVAHELTHAAAYFYMQEYRLNKRTKIDDEEVLCHLVGDLVHKVTDKLYEYKVWGD